MQCQHVDPATGDGCDLETPWRMALRLETPPGRTWPREPGLALTAWLCDEHQPDRDTLSEVLLVVRPSTIDRLIDAQEDPGVRQVLEWVRIWSSTSSARRQRAGVEDVPLFDSVEATYKKAEGLTPRQSQVLALLGEGRTGESIAKELGLSRAETISEIQRALAILGPLGNWPPPIPPNLPPAASAAGIP